METTLVIRYVRNNPTAGLRPLVSTMRVPLAPDEDPEAVAQLFRTATDSWRVFQRVSAHITRAIEL